MREYEFDNTALVLGVILFGSTWLFSAYIMGCHIAEFREYGGKVLSASAMGLLFLPKVIVFTVKALRVAKDNKLTISDSQFVFGSPGNAQSILWENIRLVWLQSENAEYDFELKHTQTGLHEKVVNFRASSYSIDNEEFFNLISSKSDEYSFVIKEI